MTFDEWWKELGEPEVSGTAYVLIQKAWQDSQELAFRQAAILAIEKNQEAQRATGRSLRAALERARSERPPHTSGGRDAL